MRMYPTEGVFGAFEELSSKLPLILRIPVLLIGIALTPVLTALLMAIGLIALPFILLWNVCSFIKEFIYQYNKHN